jgi:hypothetical protein
MRTLFCFVFIVSASYNQVIAQTNLRIFPDSLSGPVNINMQQGVFYVPKTAQAANDFISNGIDQNCIRTNVIESALNNTSNLSDCLNLLLSVGSELQTISAKCDKLIFIFEKMPPWLSSSSNGAAAATSGWSILNTRPPANWSTWQTVVDSITSKIVNQLGIANAYFEVWNEPDLGSWTGTMQQYFTLYQRTYAGVKAANSAAKVGGPAVNFWANNIYTQPSYGHVSNEVADGSLIGQLLDSCIGWNKIPDFLSFHNFNLTHHAFKNATDYIQQKLVANVLPDIPIIVSEWNAPSSVRDTKLATSFMLKGQFEMAKTSISNNAIAAWQDFDPSSAEFHNDYGLLTYGGLHKPAYNSVLLSNTVQGNTCKKTSNKPLDVITSIQNDTLSILLSNYCPPPFLEAFNATLFSGKFTANQLDSAGYIDISGNNPARLDSIYKGLILLPASNSLAIAVNNSIPIYTHFTSILTTPRQFNIDLDGFTGNYAGKLFIVDSNINNMQFKYDSLRNIGNNQTAAIATLLPNQELKHSNISVSAGNIGVSLTPNAVALYKIILPGISNLSQTTQLSFRLFPNPAKEYILVESITATKLETIFLYNAAGEIINSFTTDQQKFTIDISKAASGIYFIGKKGEDKAIRFVKE